MNNATPTCDDRAAALIDDANRRFGDYADMAIRDALELRPDVILPEFTGDDLDVIDALLRRASIVEEWMHRTAQPIDHFQIACHAATTVVIEVTDPDDLMEFQDKVDLGFAWLAPVATAVANDWRVVSRPLSRGSADQWSRWLITHQINNAGQHVGWLAIQD